MDDSNGTSISLSFENKVKDLETLTKYERELRNIYGYISAMQNPRAKKTMDDINDAAKNLNKQIKETDKDSKNMSKALKSAFGLGAIVAYSRHLKGLVRTMANLSQKSVEYIENVNLLEVAYKNQNEAIEESSKRIETYIDKMAEVYGLDESRLTRQFGIFKQLANAMQLPTETAENLSEIMVKMTNDIASLYNLPLSRAGNALQSALAGQVRPIRSATGADITEKTLQNTVVDLGLDRTISELSYVEKRLVMVISLTKQLKNSQGDYARTIESASNQIRVMHDQWDRLSRALGNVFYPILEKILPVVNGVLMALTEIFNLIATLLGFKMPEFDYSGLSAVDDYAIDIEEELSGAGDAVDELAKKLKGLRAFDKLNVINTPSDSKASGVGVGSGYIDPKILDAFNNAFSEYDDMMDKVQMKATKIRDSIMEWLGFTKQVDEETGEISWKFDHITGGTVLGGLIAGGAIYTGVSGLFKMFTRIGKILGLSAPAWLTTVGQLAVAGVGGAWLGNKLSQGIKYLHDEYGVGINEPFDIYLEKDMFSWWKEDIIPAIQEDGLFGGKRRQRIYDQEADLIEKQLDLLAIAQESGNQEFIDTATQNIMDYIARAPNEISMMKRMGVYEKHGLQFEYANNLGQLANAKEGGITGVSISEEEQYRRSKATLFNQEDAQNVTDYVNALQGYFDLVSGNVASISEFKDIMDESNANIGHATQGIQNMLTLFGNENYTITEENLQKLNGYFQELETNVALSSQAFVEAVALSTSKLKEQGYISDETAQKVMDNAYRKQEAEKGATREYIEGSLALQKQLQNNEITQEEYYKGLVALYNQYNKTPSAIVKFKTKLDIFNTSIKITGKNWDEVSNKTEEAKNSHAEATQAINDDIKEQIDMYTEWASTVDRTTAEGEAEYQTYVEVIEGLNQQQKDSLAEVDKAYELFLLNALESIADSREYTTAEGQKMVEDLTAELSKLGVDVDLSAGQKNVLDQVREMKSEIEKERPTITIDFQGETKNLQKTYDTIQTAINGAVDYIKENGLLKAGITAGISLIKKIPSIKFNAQGDLPKVGQLMVVNEKGAELVGHIGGQSFVANQQEIVDFMDKKIGNAQTSKQPKIFNFYLDENHLIATYTLDQLESLAKTNGSAITIGG